MSLSVAYACRIAIFLARPLQQACLIYLFRIFRTPLGEGRRQEEGAIAEDGTLLGLSLSVWVSHFVVHKTKPNKVVKKLFKHNDMLLATKVL